MRTDLIERRLTKKDESETDDETRGFPSRSRKNVEESVLEREFERGGELVELVTDDHLLLGSKAGRVRQRDRFASSKRKQEEKERTSSMVRAESTMTARAAEMWFFMLMLADLLSEMTARRGMKSWMAEVERI